MFVILEFDEVFESDEISFDSSVYSEDLEADFETLNLNEELKICVETEKQISHEQFPPGESFIKIPMPKDGDCLFNSLLTSHLKKRDDPSILRELICDFMAKNSQSLMFFRTNQQQSFEKRVERMRNN